MKTRSNNKLEGINEEELIDEIKDDLIKEAVINPISFWEEYLKSDYLEKVEIIRKLPIIKTDFIKELLMDNSFKIEDKEKMIKNYFLSMLISYLDDFEEAVVYLNKKSKK